MRLEVAEGLRGIEAVQFDEGELVDCGEVEAELGLASDDGAWYRLEDVMRLADLIDPTCKACLCTMFHPATELTPEFEEDVYVCSECGEVLSYDEDFDPDTDYPAYCESCGFRVAEIGEPCNE